MLTNRSDGRSNTGNPPIHISLLDITGAKTSSVSMKSEFPVKFGFNTSSEVYYMIVHESLLVLCACCLASQVLTHHRLIVLYCELAESQCIIFGL